MLVRIGEPEKEPRFVNVRLVIVVRIQSITFEIHQSKCSACVLNLLLEYHWAGRPTRAVHDVTPSCMQLCYKAVYSVIEHGMTPFPF